MCMEPPRPWQVPASLPISSAIIDAESRPLARTWPWPRWVEVMPSRSPSGQQEPTALASWPMDRCRKPGISVALYSSEARSSKRRMRRILRYISSSRSVGVVWVSCGVWVRSAWVMRVLAMLRGRRAGRPATVF